MPPADRYHVLDNELQELAATTASKADAMVLACKYAAERGCSMQVYDSMGHHGAVDLWQVDRYGVIVAEGFLNSNPKELKR